MSNINLFKVGFDWFFMSRRLGFYGKGAGLIAVLSFLVSIYFSTSSFTGYAISENVNVYFNSFSVLFFFTGIIGSWFALNNRDK